MAAEIPSRSSSQLPKWSEEVSAAIIRQEFAVPLSQETATIESQ
jgi:hypothetical protein